MASIGQHPAPGAFDYRPAWQRRDAAIEADALRFWRSHDILPDGATPEARAKALAAAAYLNGKLVAAATASLSQLDFLRARFAMLRVAVDPEHRRSHAAFGLAVYTRALLEQWSDAHPGEKVAGVGAIIEGQELGALRKEPFWPTTRLGLVGYTGDGRQIRVSWFEQFRLD